MVYSPGESIEEWDRIESAEGTVLSPEVRLVHYRRRLFKAALSEQCANVCSNDADFILKERPATLVTRRGERVRVPYDLDYPKAEATLSHLGLSEEQIRFLIDSRKRLSLCMDCIGRRKREESE